MKVKKKKRFKRQLKAFLKSLATKLLKFTLDVIVATLSALIAETIVRLIFS